MIHCGELELCGWSRHIARFLEGCTMDCVMLQEVWVQEDVDLLIEGAAKGPLKFGHHFKSGIFGSGLVTLSRFPIKASAFWPYRVAGNPLAVHVGDYYASKGIGWCRLSTPLGDIDVVNTHLHANYAHKYSSSILEGITVPTDPFAHVRLAQILQLATILNFLMTDQNANGLIFGGDLNSTPSTLEVHALKMLVPGMCDVWVQSKCTGPGFTFNVSENWYCKEGGDNQKERIDYLWSNLTCAKAEVVLKKTREFGLSYSDHCGLHATFRVDHVNTRHGKGRGKTAVLDCDSVVVLNEVERVLENGKVTVHKRKVKLLWLSRIGVVSQLVVFIWFTIAGEECGRVWVCRAGLAMVLIITAIFSIMAFLLGFLGEGPQQRALEDFQSHLKNVQKSELGERGLEQPKDGDE